MAGNPYRKVQAGQPLAIPAQTWNDLMDCIADLRKRQSTRRGGAVNGYRPEGAILIRNDAESDLQPNQVLGIDGVLITPADNENEFRHQPMLKGSEPDEAVHRGKFAVTLDYIAPGQLGRAIVTGKSVVKLNVVNESDEWADIADGVTATLKTGSSGSARILYKEAGTGTKWGVVRLGEKPRIYYGTVTGSDFSSGATFDLNPCTADGVALGGASVTVKVKKDGSSYSMANDTVVAMDTVVPYVMGSDGWYVFGKDPVTIQTATRWNTSDGTIEIKTRDDWGNFCGTESDWFDASAEYEDCE